MNAETIKEIITLITLAGEYGTELYLKLKAIGELGPDEQANIHRLIMEGIDFDQAMKDRYAQWRVEVGLDPALPVSAAPAAENTIHFSPSTEVAKPEATPTPSTVHDSSHTIPPDKGSD
jgi:hypothetical protein